MTKPTVSPQVVYRAMPTQAGGLTIDKEARTVELAFASDYAVDRGGWTEVLDMRGMDQSRIGSGTAALLLEHNPKDQIGVVQSTSVGADNVARAVVRFSQSARGQEVFQDVIDGIRTLVSVGYRISAVEPKGSGADESTYRVSDWMPFEISFVSIPADPTVGVGRSAFDALRAEPAPEDDEDDQDPDEIPESSPDATDGETDEDTRALRTFATPKKESTMDEIQKAVAAANQRAADILALGQKHKADEMARTFVAEGKSVDEFRTALLERPAPAAVKAPTAGMSEKDVGQYSILRAINAAASRDWSKAGLEREANLAMAKALGRDANGFFIPPDVMGRQASDLQKTAFGQGGALVQTDIRFSDFIQALLNKALVRQIGASVFDGLQGDVAFPKQLGLAATSWVGEDGVATNTGATFGQVPMSPKTVTAKTQISRKLLLQSGMSVEAFMRNHLAEMIGLAIDHAALIGGDANGPVGLLGGGLPVAQKHILGTANTYTFADIVALETIVAQGNADIGDLAYITNPLVRGALKTTPKSSSAVAAGFVWENNELNGQNAFATNQLGTSTAPMLFGNFSDLYIGFWSGLDMVVDNITDESGATKIRVFQDCDIAVARSQSFAYAANS